MNDEARMSNDEGMTKSENRNTSADESFWYNHAESTVREEPEKPRVYDFGRAHSAIRRSNHRFRKDDSTEPDNQSPDQSTDWGKHKCWRKLRRSPRFGFKKGLPQEYWNLPKGSARNKTFPANGCSGGARAEAASARAVAGSQGAAFDLLKNLERSKE